MLSRAQCPRRQRLAVSNTLDVRFRSLDPVGISKLDGELKLVACQIARVNLIDVSEPQHRVEVGLPFSIDPGESACCDTHRSPHSLPAHCGDERRSGVECSTLDSACGYPILACAPLVPPHAPVPTTRPTRSGRPVRARYRGSAWSQYSSPFSGISEPKRNTRKARLRERCEHEPQPAAGRSTTRRARTRDLRRDRPRHDRKSSRAIGRKRQQQRGFPGPEAPSEPMLPLTVS